MKKAGRFLHLPANSTSQIAPERTTAFVTDYLGKSRSPVYVHRQTFDHPVKFI